MGPTAPKEEMQMELNDEDQKKFKNIFGIDLSTDSTADMARLEQLVVNGRLRDLALEAKPFHDRQVELQFQMATETLVEPGKAQDRLKELEKVQGAAKERFGWYRTAHDLARGAGYKVLERWEQYLDDEALKKAFVTTQAGESVTAA